jgi:hypothetical protein
MPSRAKPRLPAIESLLVAANWKMKFRIRDVSSSINGGKQDDDSKDRIDKNAIPRTHRQFYLIAVVKTFYFQS